MTKIETITIEVIDQSAEAETVPVQTIALKGLRRHRQDHGTRGTRQFRELDEGYMRKKQIPPIELYDLEDDYEATEQWDEETQQDIDDFHKWAEEFDSPADKIESPEFDVSWIAKLDPSVITDLENIGITKKELRELYATDEGKSKLKKMISKRNTKSRRRR